MSPSQRTKKHRIKKEALEFSANYLDGKEVITAKKFEKAMKCKFESENSVTLRGFKQVMVNSFYLATKDMEEYDDKSYHVADLYSAWKDAEDENN